MKLAVCQTDLRLVNLRTRMPFRYGIATLTALPHLFVRVEIELDGRRQWGIAADHLPPKWFTKDPAADFRDEITAMLEVISKACQFAAELPRAGTVFDFWQQLYARQKDWAANTVHPPLLWGFGVSLVERAVIDAFCRATSTTFSDAVRENTLGIRLGDIYEELNHSNPADWLASQPLREIIVRHTVGLSDPLTEAEIAPRDRVDDGLPQSLTACIETYGLTHFKIKLGGNPAADLDRLDKLAAIIPKASFLTLDGNEQYPSLAAFRAFWGKLPGAVAARVIFVEQPLLRQAPDSLHDWPDRPPIIIDEADGELTSLRTALDRGYAGTSHKNCKGVFKGIANACLAARRCCLISGEDLSNVGPVALLQDLAVIATLGIRHLERNGHHYFRGLPEDQSADVLAHHGDLYHRHERGFATVTIRNGRMNLGSIVDAPFGLAFEFNSAPFPSVAEWQAQSSRLFTGR